MEDGRIAKVNIDDWAFIPMIPFGLLAGYWGTMEICQDKGEAAGELKIILKDVPGEYLK